MSARAGSSSKVNGEADLFGGIGSAGAEDTADLLNMGGGAPQQNAHTNLGNVQSKSANIDLISGLGDNSGSQGDTFGLFQQNNDDFGNFAAFDNSGSGNTSGIDFLQGSTNGGGNQLDGMNLLQPDSFGGNTAGDGAATDDFFGAFDSKPAPATAQSSANQQFKSNSHTNLLDGWDVGGNSGGATLLGGSQTNLNVNFGGSGTNLNMKASGSQGSLNLGSNFPSMGQQPKMTPSPMGQKSSDPFADLGEKLF